MDSIIHNITYYDISDNITLINNLGVSIYNFHLETILNINLPDIHKFILNNENILFISQLHKNKINICSSLNLSDNLTKCINISDSVIFNIKLNNPINEFKKINNIIFISDINYIYIYNKNILIDKIDININSNFNVIFNNNIYILIYQSSNINIVVSKLKIGKNVFRENNNITPHKSNIYKFKLSDDGSYIYTVSKKGTILRMFQTSDCQLIKEFRIGYIQCNINTIKINNSLIIINYDNNYIKIFNNKSNQYLSYLTESYYSYFYIEYLNFKIGFNKKQEDIMYLATDTGKLITVKIKENECEILDIKRFMDNNFNEMIRMNLSFN